MAFNDYEAVIGLEIHAQLNTASKMFCRCRNLFGAGDNHNTCPVCTGMPGALPVLNEKALEFSAKTGFALNCQVRADSVFARKNYFYPDMPKGYQISQYEKPICEKGHVEFYLDGHKRRIAITRAHMEEDAGKSTHYGHFSLINLNRCSTPLLEIVSEPELRTPQEAAEYARAVRRILRYLNVCDGNLEEGSLRCDCNVSVRKKGEMRLGTKVEIKNINSFRFIEKAVQHEIERQIDCLEGGEKIVQETRLYDVDKNRTFAMRSKEDAHDYRYFPEPDLLPVTLVPAALAQWRGELPELPIARAERFMSEYGLPEQDAWTLTDERAMAEFFEAAVLVAKSPKMVANWMLSELLRRLNDDGLSIEQTKVSASALGDLIGLIENGRISGKTAKTVFRDMWERGKTAAQLVAEQGLIQISDSGQLEQVVSDILSQHPAQVAEYRSGKSKVYGFFVGQVMKASKGQANPDLVNQILQKKLASEQ